MDATVILPCLLLLAGCGAYIFWPQPQAALAPQREKTRLDYLRERRHVIYDNLRDLNFEYKAGKFPEDDFQRQRNALELEASEVLAEMEQIAPTN